MSAQGAGAPTLSRSRAATKQAGSRRLAQKRENAVSAAPITDEAEGHSPPSAAQETSRRSSVMRQWTPSEDELLRTAVANNKASSWATIAEAVPGRNHVQCFHRWTEALKPGLVKGAWSEAEDQLLIHLKASSGQKTSWGQLSQLVPGRSTKQCRERWQNFLDPALNKSKWTEDEDIALLLSHAEVGNRWAIIAKRCPGRTKLQVRDRWRTLQKPAHAPVRQRVEAMIEAGQGFDESRSWASSARAKVETNTARGSVPVVPVSGVVADMSAAGVVPITVAIARRASAMGFGGVGASASAGIGAIARRASALGFSGIGASSSAGVGPMSLAGSSMPGVVPVSLAGAVDGDSSAKSGEHAHKRQRTHRRTLSGEAAAALVSLAAAAASMGAAAPPQRPPVLQDASSHDSTKSLFA